MMDSRVRQVVALASRPSSESTLISSPPSKSRRWLIDRTNKSLVSLGVFNSALMNDAVWKFRRYEDSSLSYMGISRHQQSRVGFWDTVLTPEDFKATFEGLADEEDA